MEDEDFVMADFENAVGQLNNLPTKSPLETLDLLQGYDLVSNKCGTVVVRAALTEADTKPLQARIVEAMNDEVEALELRDAELGFDSRRVNADDFTVSFNNGNITSQYDGLLEQLRHEASGEALTFPSPNQLPSCSDGPEVG